MNLRAELNNVRARHGVLTPQIVVEEARPTGSPLHDRFEWDDERAAEAYRLEQARELIRSVTIKVMDDDGAHDVRAFVSISRPNAPTREYVPTEEVARDEFQRELVLREMERDWKVLRAKYQHMAEFIAMVSADVAA